MTRENSRPAATSSELHPVKHFAGSEYTFEDFFPLWLSFFASDLTNTAGPHVVGMF